MSMMTRMSIHGVSVAAALAMVLSGCGVTYYDPTPRGGGGGGGQQQVALFPIDPGVGVDLPDRAFAITNNGLSWTLAWIGDAGFHRFSGQVVSGTRFDTVRFRGGFAGDQVQQTQVNQIDFSASTDGNTLQQIDFVSPSEPLRFDLDIDGQPAVFQVVFSSRGVASTSDEMPFELSTSQGATAGRTAPQATAAGGAASARAGGHHIAAPAAR